jgi:hypothetical protein
VSAIVESFPGSPGMMLTYRTTFPSRSGITVPAAIRITNPGIRGVAEYVCHPGG